MKNSFADSFVFTELTSGVYRHTDASGGAPINFLAMMLEGRARIVCQTHEISMEAGDVFFIPMGCRYNSYWYGENRVSWTSLGFIHNPSEEHYRLQIIPTDDKMRDRIRALGQYRKVDCTSVGELYSILGELTEVMETEPPTHSQLIIGSAISYMSAHPQASVSDVAKHCHISESGLYAAFRENGTTPALTKQKLQIDRAVTLIKTTDLSADEIAERVGFNSTSYFLRILKKLTGKTTKNLRGGLNM